MTKSGITRGSLFALVAGMAHCGAATPTAMTPTPGVGPLPVNALVVVPASALRGPSAEADDAVAAHTPGIVTVRVVADHGDSLEVALVADAELTRCSSVPAGIAALPLHFMVQRSDLALVTWREVTLTFDDDTSLRLAPGVRLVPLPALSRPDRAIYTAYVDGMILNVPVPRNAIADYFAPADHANVDPTETMLIPGADAVFGGRAHVGHFGSAAPRAYVYARREIPLGSMVDVRTPCAALTVRVNSAAIVPSLVPEPMGASALVSEPHGVPYLRAGATVYWPNGVPAGHTEAGASVYLSRGIEADTGARRCFRLALQDGAPAAQVWSARVCADVADVLGVPSPPSPAPTTDTDASATPADDASTVPDA